jgi:hypothetical protein
MWVYSQCYTHIRRALKPFLLYSSIMQRIGQGTDAEYTKYLACQVNDLRPLKRPVDTEILNNPTKRKKSNHTIIRQTPKDEKGWLDTRRSLAEIVTTFILLTRTSITARDLHPAPNERPHVIQVLDDYGTFAKSLHPATTMSHYSTTLFFCLATVSLVVGANQNDVNTSMRNFLAKQQGESNATELYLYRLRRTAVWVAGQVDKLYRAGLEHRAWEMFLLCKLSSVIVCDDLT